MQLGGVHEIQVDVRIITATNVDLRTAVREGKFREDLFYRLDVIRFDLPPLRARREDIPALAAHFLKRYSDENELALRTLSPEALRALLDYEWPGNVRELENVMERGVVLSSGPVIGLELLPSHITGRSDSSSLLEHNPTPRSSTSSKTSSGASSWTRWSGATGTRPTRPSSSASHSRRSIRRSSGSTSRSKSGSASNPGLSAILAKERCSRKKNEATDA